MPVNGRRLGEIVPEVNDDLVTFVRFEHGAGNAAVVRIGDGRLSRDEIQPRGLGDDGDFYCMRRARFVAQNGWTWRTADRNDITRGIRVRVFL